MLNCQNAEEQCSLQFLIMLHGKTSGCSES